MMNFKSQSFLRALGLLWRRLGTARFYVAAVAIGVLILAALGVVHLLPSVTKANNRAAHTEAPAIAATAKRQPPPGADEVDHQAPLLAISEVTPRKGRLRDGSTIVAVRVGVTPRLRAIKGEVEIRVFFFDITRDGEIRPTDAQVGYDWITPIRDWTDPAPKYLEATYLRPPTLRRSPERLRYGGFIVRVYLDGQLQDERSEPRQLLAALPRGQPPTSNTGSAALASAATPPSPDEPLVTPSPNPTPNAPIAMNPPAQKTTAGEASPPPYGSPVPEKPGFVYSPYNEKFLIDVRGVPPGTEVTDPNTGKPLRVP